MKIKELKELDVKELTEKLENAESALDTMKLNHTVSPLKFVQKTKKYHAHDEKNEANVGDTVLIMETRPLSKTKRWRLVSIIEKAK